MDVARAPVIVLPLRAFARGSCSVPFPKVPIIQQKLRAVHWGPGLPPVIRRAWIARNADDATLSVCGPVALVDEASGHRLGWGLWNPHTTQYRVRVLEPVRGDFSCDAGDLIGRALRSRLETAVALRQDVLGFPSTDTSVFRLVNREGDHLSGLAVEAMGPHLVVRASALWVEIYRRAVEDALRSVWPQKGQVIWQRDNDSMDQDGYGSHFGSPAADHDCDEEARRDTTPTVEVLENGVRFELCPGVGRKTGHFTDQREHRQRVRRLVESLTLQRFAVSAPLRVLDLFCYSGGFAVSAALGAKDAEGGRAGLIPLAVDAVDWFEPAVDAARRTAALNGVGERIRVVHANAFTYLKAQARAAQLYDVVICDPPRAVNSKGWSDAEIQKAVAYHRRVTKMSLRVLRPGGVLVACTCSQVLAQTRSLLAAVQQAAASEGRELRLMFRGGAGADHVVHPAYRPDGHLDVLFFVVQ